MRHTAKSEAKEAVKPTEADRVILMGKLTTMTCAEEYIKADIK